MKFNKVPSLSTTLRRNMHQRNKSTQTEDEEDPATTPSVEFKCAASSVSSNAQVPPSRPIKRQKQRNVHFQEEKNRVYHDERPPQTQQDIDATWYSVADLERFKLDTRADMMALHAAERLSHNEPETWGKSLLQIYQVYCAAQSVQDIRLLMPRTPTFSVSPYTIGMERRAIPPIARDAAARRNQVRAMVLHWQFATMHNATLRAEMMREASFTVSRPSRLYAHNIAVIAAAADF